LALRNQTRWVLSTGFQKRQKCAADLTQFNYPQPLDALKSLPAQNVILDGEIAALDDEGRPLSIFSK
jgi:hypothetical protein